MSCSSAAAAVALAAAAIVLAAALVWSGASVPTSLVGSGGSVATRENLAFGMMHKLEEQASAFNGRTAKPVSSFQARTNFDTAFGRLAAIKKFAAKVDRVDGILGKTHHWSSHGDTRAAAPEEHHTVKDAVRGGSGLRQRYIESRGRALRSNYRSHAGSDEGVVLPPGAASEARGHPEGRREVHTSPQRILQNGRRAGMVGEMGRVGARKAQTISLAEVPAASRKGPAGAEASGTVRREAREMVRMFMQKRKGRQA